MARIKLRYVTLLSILSGLLLWLAWPPLKVNFFIFIAIVPLLFIEESIRQRESRFGAAILLYNVFSAFLIWNLLTTYWIYYASFVGAVAAILLNSLLMSLPFLLYHKLKIVRKGNASILFLVCFWLGYEFLQLNWDLAWPWLTLGNVFATIPGWVQWYEFTGVLGGSLWIWLVNILIYSVIRRSFEKGKTALTSMRLFIRIGQLALLIIIPIIVSLLIPKADEKILNDNVVLVQPNIDPYTDKFSDGNFTSQLKILLDLSEREIDSNTTLLVWPETALSIPFDEKNLNYNAYIFKIRQFLEQYPKLKLIAGIDAYRFYEKDEKLSPTARLYPFDSSWYESYNAAILMDHTSYYEMYHKSRLVPGVEKMPYPKLFKFLEKLALNLGGTSGSLGKQMEPSVFVINEKLTAAPIICYESIFGDYVGKFIQKNANLIVVITNDGWWRNTSGYKQHLHYARLRAIEFRKDVARAANTGVSCYINSEGQILDQTEFWKEGVIKHSISISEDLTFYAKMGDYIGRIASFLSVVLILILISASLRKKDVMGI
ncbi:apolipoprotein N-acyltransferase [Bacteroidota bacterium]